MKITVKQTFILILSERMCENMIINCTFFISRHENDHFIHNRLIAFAHKYGGQDTISHHDSWIISIIPNHYSRSLLGKRLRSSDTECLVFITLLLQINCFKHNECINFEFASKSFEKWTIIITIFFFRPNLDWSRNGGTRLIVDLLYIILLEPQKNKQIDHNFFNCHSNEYKYKCNINKERK